MTTTAVDEKNAEKNLVLATGRKLLTADPDDLVLIGTDTKDGPEHPLYDERVKRPVSKALVASIMSDGIRHNVGVRKNGEKLEVVYGRQRVKAARAANQQLKKNGAEPIRVPYVLASDSDKQAMGVIVSENSIRDEDSMLAKAEKAKRLADAGYSEDEVAEKFGVTRKAVQGWLRLVQADEKVIGMVRGGKLTSSAALDIARLPRDEQVDAAKEALQNGKATTAVVKRAVKARKNARSAKSAKGKKGKKDDEGRFDPPGKVILRNLIEAEKKGRIKLRKDVIGTIRWIYGDASAKVVDGLSDAIKALSRKGK